MQAIMETAFDIVYLITVITIGVIMIKNSKGNKQHLLFGIMAVTLGTGDSFHLIPRALALCTTGLENFTVALGIGKLITSLTMTIFYILLYYVWRLRYKVVGKQGITIAIYVMAALRVILCAFPQNGWTEQSPSLLWGIIRNLPFAAMGILVIILFYKSANSKQNPDKAYKFMWLTIVLSFAFYIPVVLFADVLPIIGVLMIPKTCAYVWTILIGFNDMRSNKAQ